MRRSIVLLAWFFTVIAWPEGQHLPFAFHVGPFAEYADCLTARQAIPSNGGPFGIGMEITRCWTDGR